MDSVIMAPPRHCPLYPPNVVCTHVVMRERKNGPRLQMICRLYTGLHFQAVPVMSWFAVNMQLLPDIYCIFMGLGKEFIAS